MKQYSFLMESKDDITIHYYSSPKELSKEQKLQIQDLMNELDEVDYNFYKKIDNNGADMFSKNLDKNRIKEIEYEQHKFVTAEVNGKIVGFVCLRDITDKAVCRYPVRYVCVDKKYRGQGIGLRLMEYTKKKFKGKLFIKVIANNNPAYNLYTKVGFKPWLISMVM